MKKKNWPYDVIFLLAGLVTLFHGIKEFNTAVTWLPLLRGLFWLILGVWVVSQTLADIAVLLSGDKQ